jgi:hypothetical protein
MALPRLCTGNLTERFDTTVTSPNLSTRRSSKPSNVKIECDSSEVINYYFDQVVPNVHPASPHFDQSLRATEHD